MGGLDDLLRYDFWQGKDAALILSDVMPGAEKYNAITDELTHVETITIQVGQLQSGLSIERREFDALQRIDWSILTKVEIMRQSFEDGENHFLKPAEWVDWAIEKNYKINWLAHAFERGFLPNAKEKIDGSELLTRRYLRPDYIGNRFGRESYDPNGDNCIFTAEGYVSPVTQTTDVIPTRERETLLKIIIGMAIDLYGYAPDASRSTTASDIVSAVAKIEGMSIDPDTVRKYLKEAKDTILSGATKKRKQSTNH
nr:hypothetical protein [uncultured Duganella sp.]